ncbi:glycoside hydrolase family 172 protein [Herbihabitans rhizosphaerae]|uniref:glycoside hydrolase family 172 protein n=1 Tax=Herbihabitans rhizosphaerae TaxID=1872711 RepID=UPI001F5E4122|nr:glycoside hydrolase family 172 protein [Herbihabitans rhizosphaerae]
MALAAIALSLVIPGTTPASAQQQLPQPPRVPGVTAALADKGPIGWDVYRTLDGAARLRAGSQVKQFSSYDRTGGNDDGFVGTYSCLRITAAGCVIAEKTGAGQIESMWFTRDYGSMVNTGRIRVEMDGVTVLNAMLQDVVDGKRGAPFVWPLVGNGNDTSGGAVIKVPMPYVNSMRVTVQHNPLFYHVSYREFADPIGVRTFNPADRADDVITNLRGFGVRDPKPFVPGAPVQANTKDVAPGAAASFMDLKGAGWINQLRVRLPQVVASPRVVSDGRAFGPSGGSSFRANIHPGNSGVRITRRYDPLIADQRTRLKVEGREIAVLDSGPSRPGLWDNHIIEVPQALTGGKFQVNVATEFISSSLDVNEFRYDVHSKVGNDWVRTDIIDVGPGHTSEEAAHGYVIRLQTWNGFRAYRYPSNPDELSRSDAVLNDARLRITFDGKSTVDAPIGEFFGSGLGEHDVRNLMTTIDGSFDGWYQSWWPMPYAKGAKVEIVNGSGIPITGATVEVATKADSTVPAKLKPGGSLGYFNATHHRGQTVNGADWVFLQTNGRGLFYGATHSMRGLIAAGNRRNYLEGDERVYVDGAASPTLYGTGSEDYYESGWYFRDGTTYAMPLAGNPSHEMDGDGCQYDCTGAYRLLVGDAVSFATSLRFGIEHGPANNEPGDYGSTAYWYGQPDVGLTETDGVDVTDEASRTAHKYTAVNETRSVLESTFEGDNDTAPIRRGTTTATGPVEFTVAVKQDNAGVRLLRLGDQATAYQRATVLVDGLAVGTWMQPLGNKHSRWLEDSFELPSSVTSGKASVTVRIEPETGAPPWSASRYRVLTR